MTSFVTFDEQTFVNLKKRESMKGKSQGRVSAADKRYGRERIPIWIVGQQNVLIACRDTSSTKRHFLSSRNY